MLDLLGLYENIKKLPEGRRVSKRVQCDLGHYSLSFLVLQILYVCWDLSLK